MTSKPTYEELSDRIGELEKELSRRDCIQTTILDSKESMRWLLHVVPYPLLVTDTNSVTRYINREFTETFGWTLDELAGRKIYFAPLELRKETLQVIRKVVEEGEIELSETKRMTKSGRKIDVSIRSVYYPAQGDDPATIVTICRDITEEKQMARMKDAMQRISLALPKHTSLQDLMDYISMEVKEMIGTEEAVIFLLDQKSKEFFTLGAARDPDSKRGQRPIRIHMDDSLASHVIKSGKPLVINEPAELALLAMTRDRGQGYTTRNMIEVPLRGKHHIFGVLGAFNKKDGDMTESDVQLLDMIAGTVALSVRNARVTDKLKNAYNEVTSLNRAKDKAINHLSHELRTPVAIISGSLKLVAEKLKTFPEERWERTMARIDRNLERLQDIEREVDDIMSNRDNRPYAIMTNMLAQCADELETLFAVETGETGLIERVREQLDDLFGPKKSVFTDIALDEFISERIEHLQPGFTHRQVDISTALEPGPVIHMPEDIVEKVFDGLLKNAVENTPDEGRIDVTVAPRGNGMELVVRDYGMGITPENQRRIFEGFFSTQETMDYSSKRPYDFNAGGRGGDLLRMKIFSERFHFDIHMQSVRCPCLAADTDTCPGNISQCPHCGGNSGCHDKGGTTFTVFFPANLN